MSVNGISGERHPERALRFPCVGPWLGNVATSGCTQSKMNEHNWSTLGSLRQESHRFTAKNVVLLVECLPSMQEVLGSIEASH